MKCWLCAEFETAESETFQRHVNTCDKAIGTSPLWEVFAPRLHDVSVTTARGDSVGDAETWPVPDPKLAHHTHSTRAMVVRGAFCYTLGPPAGGLLGSTDANLVWQSGKRRLFLGSESAARSAAWLASEGVSAIVNCAFNSEPLPHESRTAAGVSLYSRLDLADAAEHSQDAGMLIRAGADAVAAAFTGGHDTVLVHCVAGMSRSTSVVLAFLVREGGGAPGTSLADVALAVKAARPVVYPNRAFWAALCALEEEWTGSCSIPEAALTLLHRSGESFRVTTHVFGDATRS